MPCANPAYLVSDKEAVQHEMTLTGQTLVADLLAPFLRLAFISPFYLTGSPSPYHVYSSIQAQATSELALNLSVVVGQRLMETFRH